MLFNVYYNENNFPLLNEIKYIVNETTGEQLTIEDFLNKIDTYDEVNYIANMQVFYPFLEKIMLKTGYECKYTKKEYFWHYTHVLKPHTYSADIYVRSDSGIMKYINKFRIGAKDGQKYFINFNSYSVYQEINTRFSKEEIEYATYLSLIKCKQSTPAGAMRDQYGINNLNSKNLVPGFAIAAASSIKNPALIEAYHIGYVAEAWSYDVNSMYLAMMKTISFLPDSGLAEEVKQAQIVMPHHYGWHQTGPSTWQVVLEGGIIFPGDWLVPPKANINPFLEIVDKMYHEKQTSKKLGGSIYRFYKQKANSFIGSFAKKNRSAKHFIYWDDDTGRYDKDKKSGIPRYDIFAIITALARNYVTELMDRARECGCTVLQVNTDGFIVDKPLPESLLSDELGGLRLDKHLTNLYIFSANRYVADGVQCISGLPADMYKPGQTTYHYNKITWDVWNNCFKLIDTKVDLMDEIKDTYKELEDVISYE